MGQVRQLASLMGLNLSDALAMGGPMFTPVESADRVQLFRPLGAESAVVTDPILRDIDGSVGDSSRLSEPPYGLGC